MPIIFYERYYTPIDRLLNKLKRKGFWLYTGLVCFSLFYLFYEVSNLPSLPPPPPPTQDPKNLKKSLKRAHTPKELRSDDDGKKKVRTEVVVTETVIAEAATPLNTIS